mmetsp:Transcript_50356/g.107241  ORF Transcript_50356/g.107241 Transcript_50356/m.107241 type:complete len:616 (+) Transcript_50356:155-2002(+)
MPKPQDHDVVDDHSASEIEDNLKLLNDMNIDQDFNIWGDFRGSDAMGQRDSLKSLISGSLTVSASEQSRCQRDSDESKEKDSSHEIDSGDRSLSVSFSALTSGEKREIRSWNIRLSRETVFSRYYFPEQWELREMKTVVEFLELENPNNTSSLLNQPGKEATKMAISSIFFPGDHDPKSVLLKRGPILFDGTDERELLLFTHGFVLSRIEFDTLLNILFTINSENPQYLGPEELRDQFNAIDSDQSGALDRCELKEVFNGMGVPISERALSDILERFDVDQDGTIDADEFITAMQSHLQPKKAKNAWDSLSSWGVKLRQSLTKSDGERKLDCAYQFSDIDKVEVINVCSSESTQALANSSWADLIFALFVKGREDPLVMVCSKQEQRLAWVDAFRTCCVKSMQMRADSGFGAAKKIRGRIGWQHRIIRASLFSLVVCNDLAGLIQKLANPSPDIDIDDQDEYHGYTALHYAVVLSHAPIAKHLLQCGAKVNLCDDDQKTPLDLATLSENRGMMKLLEQFGGKAHSSGVLFKSAVEEQNEVKSGQYQSRSKQVMAKAKGATVAMSEAMSALRERGETLDQLDNKSAQIHSNALNYADMAKKMKEKNKKKANSIGMM